MRLPLTEQKRRGLAHAIALDLLTVGGEQTPVERVAMMRADTVTGLERNLGGRSFDSVEDTIYRKLFDEGI